MTQQKSCFDIIEALDKGNGRITHLVDLYHHMIHQADQ